MAANARGVTTAFQCISNVKRILATTPLPHPSIRHTENAFGVRLKYRQSDIDMLNSRDADIMEMMAGGERYEMVQLPDSMVDTTVFVGNLCEFVNDGMLSELFQQVSKLKSVPACVARKPNSSSLRYGFVTFQTEEEKENAIIRLNGFVLNGRAIKVEPIRDRPGHNRVRVPEKIVAYTVGNVKKTRGGKLNKMRASTHSGRRVSKGDMERLNQGRNKRRKEEKNQASASRLSGKDIKSFERALKSGFVTLEGTGYRRGRKGSALATMHREWCDHKGKPQIVYCKASGGRTLDNIIVDLSPLRMAALSSDSKVVDEFLSKWKIDILLAAETSGMALNESYEEDNTEGLEIDIIEEEEEAQDHVCSIIIDSCTWTNDPISCLPSVSLGVFEGERSQAKAMAKALSVLWEVADDDEVIDFCGDDLDSKHKKRKNDYRNNGGRTKRKGLESTGEMVAGNKEVDGGIFIFANTSHFSGAARWILSSFGL
eukprot:CAMPEP_0185734060 /NCGR_PEP_ID=MMETSP1171-20130828/21278_1 /TAXON_ID=374046 /ORGANISM="Helicotheca tamensis, Strain CCMP826" /LENGTH=484 /DNA_ID=CAMNT_0028403953 /DNA_START=34 /DNA_END=1486 /DNA_ORIENTATION=+